MSCKEEWKNQVDADPDPSFHVDADPDPEWHLNHADPRADPTPRFTHVTKSELFSFYF